MKPLSAVFGSLQLISASALGHTPIVACYDRGDGTVLCEGGFSDGSSAAGVRMLVRDKGGRVLLEASLNEYSELIFDRPRGLFSVQFDAGEQHRVEISGDAGSVPGVAAPVAISMEGLTHRYGTRVIHDDLSFTVRTGRILGLLGKNGVGKTTLIKILMGFLAPNVGRCRVLGEPSHRLSPATKRRIGLVFEGHLAYDFLSIAETERFFAPWYPRWRRDLFYDLVDRLDLPRAHRVRHLSEGQRSQVVWQP
ncbi:ATP-binding cassette domain-containing protein [Thiocapsa imhoffii]|uniref:ATP-binding cassette domain-containing protein n=1 Tax=Thiocapsa imhoffii TaxID=382777 RepID=UPI0019077364|nr:ATP-binding cassette domain-containing protein [Thiocapsa imhoffii]